MGSIDIVTPTETSLLTSDHPSLWDERFIQSLHSPFSALEYKQRSERMVYGLKEELKKMLERGDEFALADRLVLVDSLCSVGLSRHFQNEIKIALDHVCREWKLWENQEILHTKYSYEELNNIAMAFYLLRSHSYPNISPSLLESVNAVKDTDEEERNSPQRVTLFLSLLRASELQFPGENDLQEIQTFVMTHLNKWLSISSPDTQNYYKVKFVLDYPWYRRPARWESRSYINLYESDDEWIRKGVNKQILELAKLDYNILQAFHQEDLKQFCRWWRSSEISKVREYRERPVECFSWGAISMVEPEFSLARITLAKGTFALYVINDIYDNDNSKSFGKLGELTLLTKAVTNWDISYLDSAHEYIKKSFRFVHDTVMEMASICSEKQGKDMERFIKYRWERLAELYQQRAEWNAYKTIPGQEEYIENEHLTIGTWILGLVSKLLVCDQYPIGLLERGLDWVSGFDKDCGRVARFADDIIEFKDGNEGGACSVKCCMKEHPECESGEEALAKVELKMLECSKSFMRRYVNPKAPEKEGDDDEDEIVGVHKDSRRAMFEMLKMALLGYKAGDGWSTTNATFCNHLKLLLFQPIR